MELDKAIEDLQAACRSLYIGIESDIADDVSKKATDVIRIIRASEQETRKKVIAEVRAMELSVEDQTKLLSIWSKSKDKPLFTLAKDYIANRLERGKHD